MSESTLVPESSTPKTVDKNQGPSKITKSIIWVAISALIASALICVGWVLLGNQSGLVGKAFFSVGLLTAFAFATIWDVNRSDDRPQWVNISSMFGWIVLLIIGAAKIWLPLKDGGDNYFYGDYFTYFGRLYDVAFAAIVIRLTILHFRLYYRAVLRNFVTFNKITGYITLGLTAVLAGLIVLYYALHEMVTFSDMYWRVTVAVAILAAVGTALVPLMNALTLPKTKPAFISPPTVVPAQPEGLMPWPTYQDGVTPLPVLPDGTPDMQAYYTGHPTYNHSV